MGCNGVGWNLAQPRRWARRTCTSSCHADSDGRSVLGDGSVVMNGNAAFLAPVYACYCRSACSMRTRVHVCVAPVSWCRKKGGAGIYPQWHFEVENHDRLKASAAVGPIDLRFDSNIRSTRRLPRVCLTFAAGPPCSQPSCGERLANSRDRESSR